MLTRRRVLISVAAILVIGVNVGLWIGIAHWRQTVQDGRLDADKLGSEIGEVRAEHDALIETMALLTEQVDDGTGRITALTTESEPILLETAHLVDITTRLDQCVSDRTSLANSLWGQSAASLAEFEAEVATRCDAALADLEAVFPGGVIP